MFKFGRGFINNIDKVFFNLNDIEASVEIESGLTALLTEEMARLIDEDILRNLNKLIYY